MVPQIVPIVCFQEVYCGSKPGFSSLLQEKESFILSL